MAILQELWILDHSGVLMVYAHDVDLKKKSRIDPQLFSGLFGALEMLSSKKMDAIVMNDSKILIRPGNSEENFHVVGRVTRKSRDKRVFSILENIHKRFHRNCGERMNTWTGDVDEFQDFHEYLLKTYF